MGKSVDTPETVGDVFNRLRDREPLYYHCLVEVFKTWHKKTGPRPSPLVTFPEIQVESSCLVESFKEWHKQTGQTPSPSETSAEDPVV
jgi:hypothetical protein